MEENKYILTTILKNHLKWCKDNGRDTSWIKEVEELSWYKRFQKKSAANAIKKLSSWK
ncbi:hypothetical protein HTVC023P_gp06 [Pelagibacter phage HTVC023P]|nr:hypothetical protein HTVC023P_gp06 [Pelagibacter phage HTVC023P]